MYTLGVDCYWNLRIKLDILIDMPSRLIPFVNDEIYHVFNRGVAKMRIYNNAYDYRRFLRTMFYYQILGPKPKFSRFLPNNFKLNNNKIVDIICYCLMPNHFHFLLKQVKESGITEFISKLSNSYTKYFNTKNQRVGPIFQGEFKSVHIETNEQLLHVSRYIHLNPIISYIAKDLKNFKWSSYTEYIGELDNALCSKEIILDQFKLKKDYKDFILDQLEYARTLESMKHKLLDAEQW